MTPGKLFEQRGDLLTLRGLKWSKNTGKRDNTTKVSSTDEIYYAFTPFRAQVIFPIQTQS